MMNRIMMKRKMIRGTKKRKTVMATAITTLLSVAGAFVAIKAAKKYVISKREDKSELEIVLDGLVEDGTITQAQEVAIQSAVTTAKQAAATADGYLTNGDNGELESVLDSSKIGTLSKLKNSISKVRSHEVKKPAEEMAI